MQNSMTKMFKKVITLALATAMVIGTLPNLAPAVYTADAATQAELTDYGSHAYFTAKYGTMTRLTGNANGGVSLSAGTYYVAAGQTVYYNCDSEGVSTPNSSGNNGLMINGNVTIVMETGSKLYACGGNGSGTTAGKAAIKVPKGSSLTFVGKGDVYAYGGSAGSATSGNNGGSARTTTSGSNLYMISGAGGSGGNGGGGAGAGIGTDGGAGGAGGSGGAEVSYQYAYVGYDRSGKDGSNGRDGSASLGTGNIIIRGAVNVRGNAGASKTGSSIAGGNYGGDTQYWSGTNIYATAAASGGGGGGSEAREANFIGAGGSGGAGGGGGGSGALYRRDTSTGAAAGYTYVRAGGGGGAYGRIYGEGGKANTNKNGSYGVAANGGSPGSGGSGGQQGSYLGGRGGSGGGSPSNASAVNSYATTLTGGTSYGNTVYQVYPANECYMAITSTPTSSDGKSYAWTGAAIKPSVKVVHAPTGTTLSPNAYTVSYSNNTNAGTAKIEIKGKALTTANAVLGTAGMAGSTGTLLSTTFDIKYDMDELKLLYDNASGKLSESLTGYPAYLYTGEALEKGTLVLAKDESKKVPQEDYIRTFENNIELSTLSSIAKTIVRPETSALEKWVTSSHDKEKTGQFYIVEKATILSENYIYNDIAKGKEYLLQLNYICNNCAPYDALRWSIISGSLPAGLQLDRNTGEIWGTPTGESGSISQVKIVAHNVAGNSRYVTLQWRLAEFYGSVRTEDDYAVSGVKVKLVDKDTGFKIGEAVSNEQGTFGIPIASEYGDEAILFAETTKDDTGRAQRIKSINGKNDFGEGVAVNIHTGDATANEVIVEQAVKFTFDAGKYGTLDEDKAVQYGYVGESLTTPIVKNVSEGKVFKGWSTSYGVASPDYVDSLTVQSTLDTVLYAVYEGVTEPIEKVEPVGDVTCTRIREEGKTLADAVLTAVFSYDAVVEGTIAWDDSPETPVVEGQSYNWTFTPNNTDAYKEVKGSLIPWIETLSITGSALSWDDIDNAEYYLYYENDFGYDSVKNDVETNNGAGAIKTADKGEITPQQDGKSYKQEFTFEGLDEGNYIVVMYKPNGYVPVVYYYNLEANQDMGVKRLWLLGDVTSDGEVTLADAAAVYRYMEGVPSAFSRFGDSAQLEAADFNRDGNVDQNDALQILSRYLGRA